MPKKPAESTRTPTAARSRAPRKRDGDATREQPPALSAVDTAHDTGSPRSTGEPSYDQIAEAAYHRFLRRGGTHGDDFNDWIEAERELKGRTQR